MTYYSSRWIEVSKSALSHNFNEVKNNINPKSSILAVVKANGYGLGMVLCAQVFQEQGARMLGVTTFEEGIALRKAGLTLPILVFGPVLPKQVEIAATYKLTITVTSRAAVDWIVQGMEEYAIKSEEATQPIEVHLKIETGMGRFGLWPEEAVAAASNIVNQSGLRLTGVYTHFATANDAKGDYFMMQWNKFQEALEHLKAAGFNNLIKHCANSAALLDFPQCHLDMVRAGTLLYGQNPIINSGKKLDLLDPWKFLARVLEVKDIPKGQGIGYGATYVTEKTTRIAVLPAGFVDGVQMEPILRPSNFKDAFKATAKLWLRYFKYKPLSFLVHFEGESAPVVGKIGMQLVMVDVTHLPQVRIGSIFRVPLRRTAPGKGILRKLVD